MHLGPKKQEQEEKTHKNIAKVAAVQEKNATAMRKPQPRPVGKVAAAAKMTPPVSQAKATALKRGVAPMQEALDEVDDSGDKHAEEAEASAEDD
ncbi:hypothetical protein C8R48DRAFT_782378 [Suillus tomentosus]|nr:hypothetical protein C8R48DRAFT_782378 [Suillus tomentosus]